MTTGTKRKFNPAVVERAARRTIITCAENAGRIESYKRAAKMGIPMVKVWLATLDGRTRNSHRKLDGEKCAIDKKFSNGCRYPSDPQGAAEEIYNCRCTLVGQVQGAVFSLADTATRDDRLAGMTYEEWKGEHVNVPAVETYDGLAQTLFDNGVRDWAEYEQKFTDGSMDADEISVYTKIDEALTARNLKTTAEKQRFVSSMIEIQAETEAVGMTAEE